MISSQGFWSWEQDLWKNRLENEFSGCDKPLSVQIGGNKPDELMSSVELLDPYADIIDLNVSCPHKKECGMHSGAFLLLHPNQLERAINALQQATNKPVTIKMRSGWNSEKVNTVEIVKLAENLGVASVAIHGRTKKQLYTTWSTAFTPTSSSGSCYRRCLLGSSFWREAGAPSPPPSDGFGIH